MTDQRTVTTTKCGCALVVLPDDSSRLVLCAWHSRWVTKATSVVLAGAVQEMTIHVEFPKPSLGAG